MTFLCLDKGDLLRMFACIVLGSILGAALANVLAGYQLDQLIYENRSLTQQLEEEQLRLKQFEKVHSYTPVVRRITLQLKSNVDKHTAQEIEKKTKALLTGLIGQKIQQLDWTILRDIVHNRVIPVGDDTFLLSLETIIVGDELVFIVQVGKRPKKSIEDE